MPGLQQMMDPFPLDQRAGKNRAENWRPRTRLESLHVHAAREVIQFFLRETLDAESVGGLLGKNEEQVRQVVFFEKTFARLEQDSPSSSGRVRPAPESADRPRLSPVPVPGGNFDDRGNAQSCARRAAIAGNRPTSCGKDRNARWRAAATRSSRDTSFSRRNNKGDRGTKSGAPDASGANRSAQPEFPSAGCRRRRRGRETRPGATRARFRTRLCPARAADPGKDRVEQMLRKERAARRGAGCESGGAFKVSPTIG